MMSRYGSQTLRECVPGTAIASTRSVGTLAGFGGRRPASRPIRAIVSRRCPVSRSILRCVQRKRSRPMIVSRSVMLSSFMAALSRRERPSRRRLAGVAYFESAHRLWPVFKCPRVAAFECPRGLGRTLCPRFVDRSPAQIVAILLDEGRYICSESTMYRLLREHGEVRERRRQASIRSTTNPSS